MAEIEQSETSVLGSPLEVPSLQINEPARRRLNLTSELKHPNAYTLALDGEFAPWAFNEVRAPYQRGLWRESVFAADRSRPLDLEIGTGNGSFFSHRALAAPERCLVGLEIKYKPLIQTIRRARRQGAENVAVARVHAFNLDHIFADGEVNDIFVFFPDPWVDPRKPRNRLFQPEVLERMWRIQKPGSRLFLKTDSREYFDWSLEQMLRSPYRLVDQTNDLHQSPQAADNFITAFEKIFCSQGILINACWLARD